MTTALLLSGGMDSIALAWWFRPDLAFTIDYGQKPAAAELRAASAAAAEMQIAHEAISVDLAALGSGDMSGLPTLSVAPVSEWWPFRNQMLVTLAAMRGVAAGVNRLLIGTLATDQAHADGTREFVTSLNRLLSLQEGGLQLEAPAIGMTAVELVQQSGVPQEVLAWAHSCHVADFACGNCRGCVKHYDTMQALGFGAY